MIRMKLNHVEPKENIVKPEKVKLYVKVEETQTVEDEQTKASSSSMVLDCFQLVDNKLRQELKEVEIWRKSKGLKVKESVKPMSSSYVFCQ